jgi:hypothetical protein
MQGDFPKLHEQDGLVNAGQKLNHAGLGAIGLHVFGQKEDFAAGAVRVEHGDANDLSGKRPETELPAYFLAPGQPRGGIGQILRLAKEVFLLDSIKLLQGQSGGFYVEDKLGHATRRIIGPDGNGQPNRGVYASKGV